MNSNRKGLKIWCVRARLEQLKKGLDSSQVIKNSDSKGVELGLTQVFLMLDSLQLSFLQQHH